MLSRAFVKPQKSPRYGEGGGVGVGGGSRTGSIHEYGYGIVGFMNDLPLIFCDQAHDKCRTSEAHPRAREVLRSSVGVLGESRLGMTEKVVLSGGRVWVVKRFRKVTVGRAQFGRSIGRLAQVSSFCPFLVPVKAYLYAKRIKFVISDYYPMGSLADLLAGGRKLGHTAFDWNQRLKIVLNVAQAVTFIHAQSSPLDKLMQMDVHGNIKASNIMINVDFTASLSNYGFTQLAEQVEVVTMSPQKSPPSPPENTYSDQLNQKADIYNFGVVVLDVLGGPNTVRRRSWILEKKEEIKAGIVEFFEFKVGGRERNQAGQVLDIALACTSNLPEARPSMDQVRLNLGDIRSNRFMF